MTIYEKEKEALEEQEKLKEEEKKKMQDRINHYNKYVKE
eukprot:CAMPEP_0170560482 /NCGR_PEP_ID=MMETSP0211-20121228/49190_1 /TAXON_ID=311385 /ORGANISM="Pseudokeronopsis sp., Strain OXSARD2" /LENGTH=38 /DNA_ID= /DNA_START= /DNA_END= /DNA_ORIENTATION=